MSTQALRCGSLPTSAAPAAASAADRRHGAARPQDQGPGQAAAAGRHRRDRPRRPRPDRRRGPRRRAACRRSSTCSPSSTGRYPNAGPLMLARAGVRLVDAPGGAAVRGAPRRRRGRDRRRRGAARRQPCSPPGRLIDRRAATEQLERQRERIDEALSAFAENTIEHVRDEGELLLGGLDLPADAHRLPRPPRADRGPRAPPIARTCATLRAYIQDYARCWSASTAAPTRSSRRASSRT